MSLCYEMVSLDSIIINGFLIYCVSITPFSKGDRGRT